VSLNLNRRFICYLLALQCCIPWQLSSAQTAEQLILELEAIAPDQRGPNATLYQHIESASFTPAQLTRITTIMLREDFPQRRQLLASFNRSPNVHASVRSEAIRNLIELVEQPDPNYWWTEGAEYALRRIMELGRFDQASYERILSWLASSDARRRRVAISVIGATPETHPDLGRSRDALVEELSTETYQYLQSRAVEHIARLSRSEPLPEQQQKTLREVAHNANDMHVRLDVIELLNSAGISDAVAEEFSRLIIKELTGHDSEAWKSANGRSSSQGLSLDERAITVLSELYDPPYPEYIIDAWIENHVFSIDLLRAARNRGELSGRQLARLEELARKLAGNQLHYARANPGPLYGIVLQGTDPRNEIWFLIQDFIGEASRLQDRIHAGFVLRYIGEEYGVEADLHDAARKVLFEENAPGPLLGLAADIVVIEGKAAGKNPDELLLKALRQLPDNRNSRQEFVQEAIWANAELQPDPRRTLLNYARDESNDWSFRISLLQYEARRSKESAEFPSDIEELVRHIAKSDGNLRVRRAAADVLTAFHRPRPLRSIIENKRYLERTFSVIYLGVVIGTLAMFVLGIAAFARRGWAIVGWLLFSVWMIFCFLVGVVFSIGHNYAPPLSQVLAGNLLFFLSFAIYVTVAVNGWRSRHAKRTPR
jgi:hypothetical protein